MRDGTVRTPDPIVGRDDRFATMETRRDIRIRTNAFDSHPFPPMILCLRNISWLRVISSRTSAIRRRSKTKFFAQISRTDRFVDSAHFSPSTSTAHAVQPPEQIGTVPAVKRLAQAGDIVDFGGVHVAVNVGNGGYSCSTTLKREVLI
jgi:hypothetical protein